MDLDDYTLCECSHETTYDIGTVRRIATVVLSLHYSATFAHKNVIDPAVHSALDAGAERSIGCCTTCGHFFSTESDAKGHSRRKQHHRILTLDGFLLCAACGRYARDPVIQDICSNMERVVRFTMSHRINPFGIPAALYAPDPPLPEPYKACRIPARLNKMAVPLRVERHGAGRPEVRGLVNLGLTCYLSSVVSILVHSPFVRGVLLSGMLSPSSRPVQHRAAPLSIPPNGLTAALRRLALDMYLPTTASPVIPTEFLTTFWGLQAEGSAVRTCEQQDAHEVLLLVLDTLHNELAAAMGYTGRKCPCIIHTLFAGITIVKTTCPRCQRITSVDHDQFMALSVPVPPTPNPSIAECITLHLKSSTCNKACANCQHPTTIRSSEIYQLPRSLILHVKLFEHSLRGVKKSSASVSFPHSLCPGPWIDKGHFPAGLDAMYDLQCVIVHTGTRMDCGHYLSYVLSRGVWHHIDDQNVTPIPPEALSSVAPYLLVYVLRE